MWEIPRIGGTILGGPPIKDDSRLGPILGFPDLGKTIICTKLCDSSLPEC